MSKSTSVTTEVNIPINCRPSEECLIGSLYSRFTFSPRESLSLRCELSVAERVASGAK